MRRPELTEEGFETWMEIYEAVSPEFLSLLNVAVKEVGFEDTIHGHRHVERFVDVH